MYHLSFWSIWSAISFFVSHICFHTIKWRRTLSLQRRLSNCSANRIRNLFPVAFALKACKSICFLNFGSKSFNKCNLKAVPSQYLSILDRVRFDITFLLIFLVWDIYSIALLQPRCRRSIAVASHNPLLVCQFSTTVFEVFSCYHCLLQFC